MGGDDRGELVLSSQRRCRHGGQNGRRRRLKEIDDGGDARAAWYHRGKCRTAIAAAGAVSVERLKWGTLTVAPEPFSRIKERVSL